MNIVVVYGLVQTLNDLIGLSQFALALAGELGQFLYLVLQPFVVLFEFGQFLRKFADFLGVCLAGFLPFLFFCLFFADSLL
jgi:hypothetical protein